MVLEWTPEEDRPFSAAASLKRSMGDSEPPDIFQPQSTGCVDSLGAWVPSK